MQISSDVCMDYIKRGLHASGLTLNQVVVHIFLFSVLIVLILVQIKQF